MRRGLLSLPVPGMVAPPLLDPLHLGGAPEGVAVAVPAQPASLAGGLAGLSAGRFEAVLLPIDGAPVGNEKLAATAALASAWRADHRERDAAKRGKGRKPKKTDPKKTKTEEGSRALG